MGVAPLVVLAETLPFLDLIQPAGAAYPAYRDVAPALVWQTRGFKLSAPVNGTFPEHRLNTIGFQDLAVYPSAVGRLMAASPFTHSEFRPPRPLLPAGLVVALSERPELLPSPAQPMTPVRYERPWDCKCSANNRAGPRKRSATPNWPAAAGARPIRTASTPNWRLSIKI